jgi:hypothetical protein
LDRLLELLLQLVLEGVQVVAGALGRLLLRFRASRGDDLLELDLPLGACRLEAGRREPLALGGALTPGLGHRLLVMVFQGRELLIERASQLRLQIVDRHEEAIIARL